MSKKPPPIPPPLKPVTFVPVPDEKVTKKRKTGSGYRYVDSAKHGDKVTQANLGRMLGVTTPVIVKWRKLGLPSVGVGREIRFDTADVIRWKINYDLEELKDKLNPDTDPERMNIIEARTRREVAGALMAELNLAKEREQVANIDYLMDKFSSALIEVRASLVSMSSRLSGILSHQDEDEVGKLLDDEIAGMLESLSEYE